MRVTLEDITVGIPTVARPQELERTLTYLSDVPNIIVFMNGAPPASYEDAQRNFGSKVKFLSSRSNIGVAGAWNRLLIESNTRWVILSSDDLEYPSGWEEKLLDLLNTPDPPRHISLSWPMTFSSFCVDKQLICEMGWFDQNFLCAYFEDEDWYLRLRELRGLHGNRDETYEHVIPALKTVVRRPHAKGNWDAVANYVYFRLKWKPCGDETEALHTRVNKPVCRAFEEPRFTDYEPIRAAYANFDFSSKEYGTIAPKLYLRALKFLGSLELVKRLVSILKTVR